METYKKGRLTNKSRHCYKEVTYRPYLIQSYTFFG